MMSPLPRRVLFVTSAPGRSRDAIRRADAMAQLLAGELHVLLTGPCAAARAIHAWCEEALHPSGLAFERLHWTTVPPLRGIRLLPREVTPDLIVLAAGEEISGRFAVRLARELRTPVLVAGHSNGGAAIVAAIDPSEAWLPLVRDAAELAIRKRAPALFLCNVPRGAYGDGNGWLARRDTTRALVALARLRCVVSTYDVDAETVVSRREDAAEAIVRAAQARQADLIVSGVAPLGWLGRLAARPSVAARLVDEARRSVLLIPLSRGQEGAFARLPMTAESAV